MIEGGFYLKARRFQKSWIAQAPPHVREIWDWILLNANYKDHGKIKRGQILTTYKDIQDDLAWYIGYRKVTYKKHHCDNAMRALKKATMVTTAKTTRGLIITVLNYDKYQNPKNYEGYSDNDTTTTMQRQPADTIRKEGERKEIEKDIVEQEKETRQHIPFKRIVSYLNEKSNRDFKHSTKSTQSKIRARWNEGNRLEDFIKVIDFKVSEWLTDDEYSQYLRPDTLFGTKFEGYLQAAKSAATPHEGKSRWNREEQQLTSH